MTSWANPSFEQTQKDAKELVKMWQIDRLEQVSESENGLISDHVFSWWTKFQNAKFVALNRKIDAQENVHKVFLFRFFLKYFLMRKKRTSVLHDRNRSDYSPRTLFFFAMHVFRKKFVNRTKVVKLSGTAGVNVKSSTGRSTRKSAKCCAKIRKKRAACIIPLPFFLQISVFSTQYFFTE